MTDQEALEQLRTILSQTAAINEGGGEVRIFEDDGDVIRRIASFPLDVLRRVLPAAKADALNQATTRIVQAQRGIAADTLRDAADRAERGGGSHVSAGWLRDLADAHNVGTPGLRTYSIEPETPAAETPAPELGPGRPGHRAYSVAVDSATIAEDALQAKGILSRPSDTERRPIPDMVLDALTGQVADLANQVQKLAVIVAERGQS